MRSVDLDLADKLEVGTILLGNCLLSDFERSIPMSSRSLISSWKSRKNLVVRLQPAKILKVDVNRLLFRIKAHCL